MKGKHNGNQKFSLNPNGISVCHCDILEYTELEELSQYVYETFGGIDIVIDNGIVERQPIANGDCRSFIDSTGGRLRSTINVSSDFDEHVTSKTIEMFICFSYSCNSYRK